jgi:hypothetical protein
MKLYYIIDKLSVDKNDSIIVPIVEKDTIYEKYNSINLFDKLFDENILEDFDEKKSLNDYHKLGIRLFYAYSIETDNLDLDFSLVNYNYKYTLKLLHENIILIEYKENYLYSSDFQKLDWKLENILCVNKNKFESKFIFNNDNDTKNNIKKLIEVIICGDSAERLLRLNNILNDFNNDMKKCSKELYEILYEFSFGNYYDINSNGTNYYNAMAFLREKYNTDPLYIL